MVFVIPVRRARIALPIARVLVGMAFARRSLARRARIARPIVDLVVAMELVIRLRRARLAKRIAGLALFVATSSARRARRVPLAKPIALVLAATVFAAWASLVAIARLIVERVAAIPFARLARRV
jgi:hypothetical protein